jgi:hypothetical protein
MNIDYGQDDLFGKKIISSIGFKEQEIIRDILFLHANGKQIDVDCCYSTGNFYKKGLPQPKHKFDKFPQLPDVIEATADKLPLENESCELIMFDPPFIMGASEVEGSSQYGGITGSRFTAFKDWDELKEMYAGSLKEFYRVLKPNGTVIFKCQDCNSSGKQHFTHCWVMQQAIKLGFYPKDLFILFAKNRINDGRKQQHARKFHCYFWVFQKRNCNVNYELK